MDLSIDIEEYKLNIRAATIITHNNKILVHRNTKSDHYALIGGRVEIRRTFRRNCKKRNTRRIGKRDRNYRIYRNNRKLF